MQWRVKDQVIVVTGASKGIGFGLAQCLVQRGARVALLARNESRLQSAVAELNGGASSERAFGIAVDVCDKQAMNAALQRVRQRWGRFDGIVNNVGFQFARRIEDMPPDEVRRMIELNFVGTVFGCQSAIPLLRENGGGRIVNITSSSVRDRNEFAHIAIYSACKAAVDFFTTELRDEVRADNILVTLFSSGSVFTGSIENFDPQATQLALAAWKDKGTYYGGSTTPEIMGEAIAQCFEYAAGVAPEFIEVKSGQRIAKELESIPNE